MATLERGKRERQKYAQKENKKKKNINNKHNKEHNTQTEGIIPIHK